MRIRLVGISNACSPLSGCDIKRFFSVYTKFFRIKAVKRMSRINNGRNTAITLHIGNLLLTGVVLPDDSGPCEFLPPAAWQTANTEEQYRAPMTLLIWPLVFNLTIAKFHNGAFTIGFPSLSRWL